MKQERYISAGDPQMMMPGVMPMQGAMSPNKAHSLDSWLELQTPTSGFNIGSSGHLLGQAAARRELKSRSRGKQKARYTCSYCDKVFNKKGNWQAHLRTHTKEKPFACTECGRQFTQKSNMKRHMLKIHKIQKDALPKGTTNTTPNSATHIAAMSPASNGVPPSPGAMTQASQGPIPNGIMPHMPTTPGMPQPGPFVDPTTPGDDTKTVDSRGTTTTWTPFPSFW
jgi:uncharacterized Zn-finger protein